MGRRPILPAVFACVVLAALIAGCGSSSKSSSSASNQQPVSGQIVGTMFNGPVLNPNVSLGQQLSAAVAAGVESVRVPVQWTQLQPIKPGSKIPPRFKSLFVNEGGVPTNFQPFDGFVAAAAQRGLSILPVVEYTPSWAAQNPATSASPPKSPATYAAFLTALVKRYGPDGTFWSAHPNLPRVPIRMWQVWNEPHFTKYWTQQPFAPSFVKLLAAAHAAIKAADPSAKVVLAGLADFSWEYLAEIYTVPGASRYFDIVAVHPYTAHAAGVITILQRVRAVMDKNGDAGKPMLATEVTWPSSQGKAPPQFGVSTTEAQQAARLRQLFPLLEANAAKLHLLGFYWYTWMGDEGPTKNPYAFNYAGLVKYVQGTITDKPALAAFKAGALQLEGCHSKTMAGSCAS